jgi:hypothetical protein
MPTKPQRWQDVVVAARSPAIEEQLPRIRCGTSRPSIGACQEDLSDGQPLSRGNVNGSLLPCAVSTLTWWIGSNKKHHLVTGLQMLLAIGYPSCWNPSGEIARMTRDYLIILAMSAEPERDFSGAKITLFFCFCFVILTCSLSRLWRRTF